VVISIVLLFLRALSEKAPLDLALGLVGEPAVLQVAGNLALDRALARYINRIRQPAEKAGARSGLSVTRSRVAPVYGT